MRYQHTAKPMSELVRNQDRRSLSFWQRTLRWVAVPTVVLVAASAYGVQDSPALRAVSPRRSSNNSPTTSARTNTVPAARRQEEPSTKGHDSDDYGPLLDELGRLASKLQAGVELPAPHNQSKLLPLLPGTTNVYSSVGNYGEAIYQAMQIFHQQLPESPALNDIWQNKVGMVALIVDDAVEKLHQFSQYLGDEIVISGTVKEHGGSLLIMTQARKPGLKAFIDQLVGQYGNKAKPPVRVFTPAQLLAAKTQPSNKPLLVLVRPDFVVASSDLSTLQAVNAQLNRGGGRFAATPFGQRVAQAYQGGANFVLGADLQPLEALRPRGPADKEAIFEQTGFNKLKYLIVQSKYGSGMASSDMELSFNGPRRGVAGWLAAPTQLNGLDFVSEDATYAGSIAIKNPAQVFDDIKNISVSVNPSAQMSLEQAETELNLNLKNDLLSKLGGQFTFAVDGPLAPVPAWKMIVQVTDAEGLQKTLKQLIALAVSKSKGEKAPEVKEETVDGVTYTSLRFFTGPKPTEIVYAFVDGNLVAGGSRAIIKEAAEIHRSGRSLGKSSELRAMLPPDRSSQASALLFQNSALIMASFMQQLSPSLAKAFQPQPGQRKFTVSSVYGDESSIRVISNGRGLDLNMLVMSAAIAIPNIMRARTSANEAAAASTVRTLNVAQTTYATTYPNKGFAPDLATLGPGSGESCQAENGPSDSRACLVDGRLGSTRCTSGRWCSKDSFRYSISATCKNEQCQDYVVVATPNDSSSGTRSFCSTSDAVVRARPGPPLGEPVSAAECQSWEPI